ncbi:MAG: DivIVA domain-containing protein [Nocardioides sp.]
MSDVVWFFAILTVLALGGIAVVASGRGTPMARAYDDRPDAVVPAGGTLSGHDLRRVRFSLAFRGYRMSEVDALLDRLAAEKESAEKESAEKESAEKEWAEPDQSGDAPRPSGRGNDESH